MDGNEKIYGRNVRLLEDYCGLQPLTPCYETNCGFHSFPNALCTDRIPKWKTSKLLNNSEITDIALKHTQPLEVKYITSA